MTVKGETFDEDILKLGPMGSVREQADAAWGGDPSRKSTSGVNVRVKATTGKWYMVQSVSRTQTAVISSTAEEELISMMGGVCEM